MPSRYAFYSANIVILSVITHGELSAEALFGPVDVPSTWHRQALLWKSQIVGAEWQGLVDAIHLTKIWRNDTRDLLLRLPRPDDSIPEPDLSWQISTPPHDQNDGWYTLFPDEDAHFLCDPVIDYYRYAVAPAESMGPSPFAIYRARGTSTSPTYAMLELLSGHAEANAREPGLWNALDEDWNLTARLLRSSAHFDAVVPLGLLGSVMGVEMTTLLFDRIGRGGDDDTMAEAVNLPSVVWGFQQIDIAALDAALRLAEGGGDTDLLDLTFVWSMVDQGKVALSRPDLVKRLRNVALEQGWEP
ncbi:hypothetical protein [Umezawaea tangerina]|uniref:Uncharacterized protein n=1 Tax=Umezawaea tangerina TaxID=84725 RepID=A0A2T0SP88_9PSEU|nr:hypothetical protein [Umezawaea tangerina]PRY35224.1 hypothetical protein CLV43_114142 [Umezawaea tangerina]